MKKTNKNAILEHIHESFRVKDDILPYISTPLHYHPHYELVWIKKGFGKRIVGDHIDRFKEGDMVLLGPNLPHVWENDEIYHEGHPDLKVDVFVVHFTDDIIDNLLKFLELTGIKNFLKDSQQGLHIKGETNAQLAKSSNSFIRRPLSNGLFCFCVFSSCCRIRMKRSCCLLPVSLIFSVNRNPIVCVKSMSLSG